MSSRDREKQREYTEGWRAANPEKVREYGRTSLRCIALLHTERVTMKENDPAQPHAVYRIFDEAARLLYVGISCEPDRRITHHSSQAVWFAEYARHTVTWYDNRNEALDAEAVAINSERPRHNVMGQAAEWKTARITLNLTQSVNRDLFEWAAKAATDLGIPRIGPQNALRAMLQGALSNDAASAAALNVLRREALKPGFRNR